MSQAQSEMIFNLLKRKFVSVPEADLRKLTDKAQKLKPVQTPIARPLIEGQPNNQRG